MLDNIGGVALLSGDTGGDSLSLTLPLPSPLVAPPPELAPRRYPRGLAMRVALGALLPLVWHCGVRGRI
jgi:hypothetical protein